MFIENLRLICISIDNMNIFVAKLTSFLVPILAFVVFFEVILRYVFNSPTIWSYDISLFLFGYIAALSAGNAQYRNAHISVDIIYRRVSSRTKNIFNIVSYFLIIFFLIVLFCMVIDKLIESVQYDFRRQGEWGPIMWHFWLMLCIASILLILQFLRDLISESYNLITNEKLIVEVL